MSSHGSNRARKPKQVWVVKGSQPPAKSKAKKKANDMDMVFGPKFFKANGHGRDKPLTGLGAGDSMLLFDVLPDDFAKSAFNDLRDEVDWQTMAHKGGLVPRLISIQGTKKGGCEPVYRHPADVQPQLVEWTPNAERMRAVVSKALKQEMNHALIQLYRDGRDFIGEHTDKTLDILKGSNIVNLSLGASRVMVIRTKEKGKNRRTQRIVLPHNSVFVMGWNTNRQWTHAIRQDKRRLQEKRADELNYDG